MVDDEEACRPEYLSVGPLQSHAVSEQAELGDLGQISKSTALQP
jgi:hypothetical protein